MVSKVGAHEVWKVTSRDFIAPSTTTILTHNVTDGTVSKIEGAAGSSALGQLAGPAAAVGAAYFIGKGIEESGDQNTTNVNQAQDGASANSEGSYARAEGGVLVVNQWLVQIQLQRAEKAVLPYPMLQVEPHFQTPVQRQLIKTVTPL